MLFFGKTYCTGWQARGDEDDWMCLLDSTRWCEFFHIHLLREEACVGRSIVCLIMTTNVESMSVIRCFRGIAFRADGVYANTIA